MHGPLIYEYRELGDGDHIHNATSASATEFNCASCHCEKCVVLAASYICAWVEVGATLTHEDLAVLDYLTAEALNSEVLRV
jgi:hypothetical protein